MGSDHALNECSNNGALNLVGSIGRRARVYEGRIARSHLALARRMRLPGSPPALASSTMGERWRCLRTTGPLS